MSTWLALALLLPTLALAAPSPQEWTRHEGSRVEVVYVDGTRETGTVVAIEGDQVRLRKDNGALTLVPMSVVTTVTAAGARTVTPVYDEEPPPPETTTVEGPRRGPSIGLGLGVGVGPVSVGVGGVTGGGPAGPVVEAAPGGRYKARVVGVRYPLRGQETVDWLLYDDAGAPVVAPPELLRSRALREYTFVDEWGRSIPWQSVWAGMGAERDYVAEVKRLDRTMVPLRATETALGLGGIGLIVYSFLAPDSSARSPYLEPAWIAGTAMIVGNITFSLAVTNPTRNRMKAEIGRKGLERAQAHYAPDPG